MNSLSSLSSVISLLSMRGQDDQCLSDKRTIHVVGDSLERAAIHYNEVICRLDPDTGSAGRLRGYANQGMGVLLHGK